VKIERIRIDGFGRFDRFEETLAPGLNVVFGPNEAGKSTLLSFVRAMLFGFPRRSEPSRYEPERGPFGGEILLSTRSGPLWIRRTGSRRRFEGELSLRGQNGERAPPLRLMEALSGISRQLFFQVFAFGLDELSTFDELAQEGSVAEALFAAGMRGARRLPFALEALRRSSESIFTPRGRRELTSVLSELEMVQEQLRSIGDRPAQYFQALQEQSGIEREREAAEAEARRLSRGRDELLRLRAGMEELLKLGELERELAAFPPLGDFPLDATLRLEELLGRLARARAEAEGAAEQRRKLQETLSEISFPEKLAAAEHEAKVALASFQSRLEQLRSLRIRSAGIRLRRAHAEESLRALGASIGPSEFLHIDLSPLAREKLWGVVRQIEGARARMARAQECQSAAAEAGERAQRESSSLDAQPARAPAEAFPRWLFRPLWLLLAAVAIASPILFAAPQGWVCVFLDALLATALLVFQRRIAARFQRAVESFQASEALTAQQRASLAAAIAKAAMDARNARREESAAIAELGHLGRELGKWLAERGLPSVGPVRALELWVELSALQLRIRDLLVEEQALAVDERLCAAASAEVESAARRAGFAFRCAEEAASILGASLERLAQAREQMCRLGERLEANGAELARATRQCAEVEGALARLFEQAGCATEHELRVRDRQSAAFRALEADRRARSLRIEAATGMEIGAFRGEIQSRGGAEAISKSFEALEGQLRQLAQAQRALSERRGRCRAQLERWEADREIASLRSKEEILRAKASELAERYALDRLALGLLLQAQRRFEQEQQPRILRLASRAFRELTGGRYVRVQARATEPGSLFVLEAEGGEWPAEQLSRGTRDQLYLAFRLAVIEDFGDSRSPLPIILDDVLVNFDRQRARCAVKVLAQLAPRHQVIAFTCHEEVKDLFDEQGAHRIEIAPGQLGLLAEMA